MEYLDDYYKTETLTSHVFDYAIRSLRQAIDFAEIEGDFVPLRKWANEVERSGHELGEIQNRLDRPASQDFLLMILQAVSTGSLSAQEAHRCLHQWLYNGQPEEEHVDLIKRYQFV